MINKELLNKTVEHELDRIKELVNREEYDYICSTILFNVKNYDEDLLKLYGFMERLNSYEPLRLTLLPLIENSFHTTLVEAVLVYNFRYGGWLPKDMHIIFDALFIDDIPALEIERSLGINKHTVYKKKKEIMQLFMDYLIDIELEEVYKII